MIESPQQNQRRPAQWYPVVLVILSLWDLRTDLLLLLDHFTLTSLLFAIRYHLLAFAILLGCGSLWRRYR